jgi:hypothetical protein
MKELRTVLFLAIFAIGIASAAAQNAPQVSTKKVDGTENVYVFR